MHLGATALHDDGSGRDLDVDITVDTPHVDVEPFSLDLDRSLDPSDLDAPGSPDPILSYSVYRRIDGVKAGAASAPDVVTHEKAPGLWDFVLNLPASGEVVYNTLA